jgi:uncharacterized membrane protein
VVKKVMSEPFVTPAPEPVFNLSRDERFPPAVVYGLFLLSPFTCGMTALIGLALAMHFRRGASQLQDSHYVFQIRTVAFLIGAVLSAALMSMLAFPFFLIAVGILFWIFGGLIVFGAGLWFMVRSIAGLVRILQGEAYPQPRSYFL